MIFRMRGDNTRIGGAREPPVTDGYSLLWWFPEGILEGLAAIDESVLVGHFDLHEGLFIQDERILNNAV